MAHPDVVTAVKARLLASWTGTPIVVVGPDEEGETSDNAEAFVALDFPAADVTRISTGTRFYREEGGFRLNLQVERGTALLAGLAQAEALASIFRDREFAGVKTQAPGSPILDDRNDRGNFFSFVVSCPYTFGFEAA